MKIADLQPARRGGALKGQIEISRTDVRWINSDDTGSRNSAVLCTTEGVGGRRDKPPLSVRRLLQDTRFLQKIRVARRAIVADHDVDQPGRVQLEPVQDAIKAGAALLRQCAE